MAGKRFHFRRSSLEQSAQERTFVFDLATGLADVSKAHHLHKLSEYTRFCASQFMSRFYRHDELITSIEFVLPDDRRAMRLGLVYRAWWKQPKRDRRSMDIAKFAVRIFQPDSCSCTFGSQLSASFQALRFSLSPATPRPIFEGSKRLGDFCVSNSDKRKSFVAARFASMPIISRQSGYGASFVTPARRVSAQTWESHANEHRS